jgi:hypothetical protein
MSQLRLGIAAVLAFFIVVMNPVMWFYGVVADLALVGLLVLVLTYRKGIFKDF